MLVRVNDRLFLWDGDSKESKNTHETEAKKNDETGSSEPIMLQGGWTVLPHGDEELSEAIRPRSKCFSLQNISNQDHLKCFDAETSQSWGLSLHPKCWTVAAIFAHRHSNNVTVRLACASFSRGITHSREMNLNETNNGSVDEFGEKCEEAPLSAICRLSPGGALLCLALNYAERSLNG